MFWFIPAWYAGNEWKENEQAWYVLRRQSEVDDTVKQIQLFDRKSDIEQTTILLSHAPNYRHFLHRQGLLHSNYWSCFDAIQEIKMKRPGILSFHNLVWPDGIEFVYSPFAVIAFLQGQKFAQMEFSEDGNMFLLDMYREDQMFRRNIYDDRGFLSVTAVYRDGQMAYEQYLNVSGVWKICRYADGHVEVNPKENHYLLQYGGREEMRVYQRLVYENLESLIREVFTAYVAHISPEDIFCIATHPLHSALLGEVLKDRRKIISFFNERCRLQENKAARNLAVDSDAVVVNSRDVIRQAGLDEVRQEKYIAVITPFDSRMDFGRSLQLKEQHILVAVDGLSDAVFEKLTIALMSYLKTNEMARVDLFTRQADYNIENHFLGKTAAVLKKYGYNPDYARVTGKNQAENVLEEQVPVLFFVRKCVDEMGVNRCLQEQRVVIDVADVADLFLQISALSMGIPQIVKHTSEYVQDGGNGRCLTDIGSLKGILSYYLDTLKHWNEANIAAYELGKKYTSENLVTLWREVIAYVSQS